MSVNEEQWVWHRRLSQVSMSRISQLKKLGLVRGLPNLKFASDDLCEACHRGKFSKTYFKENIVVSTSRPLELLHIDLFGPVKNASNNGKKYGLVIVYDYSLWTWVKFLKHKDVSHSVFSTFFSQVQTKMDCKIVKVRSDHGGEFEINISKIFLIQMVFPMISPVLELYIKMELYKGRIGLYEKWPPP
jgi:hypothetical protein